MIAMRGTDGLQCRSISYLLLKPYRRTLLQHAIQLSQLRRASLAGNRFLLTCCKETFGCWTYERLLTRSVQVGITTNVTHDAPSSLQFPRYLLNLLGDFFQSLLGFLKSLFRVFLSQFMVQVFRCPEEILGYFSSHAVFSV